MRITIRLKLAAAFAIAVLAAAAIGLTATLAVRSAGDLVIRMYDQPLMTINFARLAQTNFATLELTTREAFSEAAIDTQAQSESIAEHNNDFLTDLDITEQRGLNPAIRDYASQIRMMNEVWLQAALAALEPTVSPDDKVQHLLTREAAAAEILQTLEILTQIAAEDGFIFRMAAEEAIEQTRDQTSTIVGVLVAIILGIPILLIRNIVVPLNRMTTAMFRLADGDMAVPVPDSKRRDEIGQMAKSLGVFRQAMADLQEA